MSLSESLEEIKDEGNNIYDLIDKIRKQCKTTDT